MIAFASSIVLSVIPFLIILTVVVTIHELGHFMAGKVFGVAMDRFSIGFGKAIWSRVDRAGVEWRIGWIPLGGYVKFTGDSNEASMPDGEDLAVLRQQIEDQLGPEAVAKFYHFKPLWQKSIIALAGPAANFALAVFLFTMTLLIVGEIAAPPKVAGVLPGSPAAAAGFQVNDTILRINGHRIEVFDDVKETVTVRAGEPIRFDVDRAGQTLTLTATPIRVFERDEMTGLTSPTGRLGLESVPPSRRHFNLFTATVRGFEMMADRLTSTLTYLRRIVTGYESGDQLTSVVGMSYVTGKIITSAVHVEPNLALRAADIGLNLTMLTALISVGVGFANLLPIPILDGGHLMFYAYEAIARRPAGPRLQAASFRVGLALVLGLMLFAAWNDLHHLQAFKFLGGLFS
jgi:regulator of sigma E protease